MRFARKRDRRKKLGIAGENAACTLLESKGMKILARNWRCHAGELDIVALDGDTLVFTEVKSAVRKSGFTPADNLSANQKKRNYNAAKTYMRTMDIQHCSGRFDLIEVLFRWNFIVQIRTTSNYLPDLPAQIPYE